MSAAANISRQTAPRAAGGAGNFMNNRVGGGSSSGNRLATPWAQYIRPTHYRSYTHACEAPPSFWGTGAVPLKRGVITTQSGARVNGFVKTYEHPSEVKQPARELGLADINSMYCIGNDELIRYFPEGIGGKVAQTFVPGHPRGFLYRQQSHLINQLVSKVPFMKSKVDAIRALCDGRPGIVFDGESGSGKSALVCQSVHYARSLGVLTLYIPNCKDWTHGEWAWPSILLPGFWDSPDAGRLFLQYFARGNKDILTQMPLRVTPKNLPIEKSESAPQTLYDLCQWGFHGSAPSNLDRQSVATKYVLDELMAEKDRPILFAIDGVNLFAGDTHFRYPHPDFYKQLTSWQSTDADMFPQELPRIPASRFQFVRALNKMMLDNSDNNKLFITCTTRDFRPFDGGVSGFPDVEGDTNLSSLDEYKPFDPTQDTVLHPVKVGNFNEYEYRSFFRYLVNSGELAGLGWGPLWHYSPNFERKLYKVDFLSGRNPQKVVDNYHGEMIWVREYGRVRQKQSLLQEKEQQRAAYRVQQQSMGAASKEDIS